MKFIFLCYFSRNLTFEFDGFAAGEATSRLRLLFVLFEKLPANALKSMLVNFDIFLH